MNERNESTFSSAPAKGMRDLLPAEVALKDWAIAIILRTYEQFGFSRIETPAMENIALLRRGEGGENLQLIFEVLKRGEKLDKELAQPNPKKENLADLGLRFDLTVPLVRFYAQNQNNLPNPLKAIQIAPGLACREPASNSLSAVHAMRRRHHWPEIRIGRNGIDSGCWSGATGTWFPRFHGADQ